MFRAGGSCGTGKPRIRANRRYTELGPGICAQPTLPPPRSDDSGTSNSDAAASAGLRHVRGRVGRIRNVGGATTTLLHHASLSHRPVLFGRHPAADPCEVTSHFCLCTSSRRVTGRRVRPPRHRPPRHRPPRAAPSSAASPACAAFPDLGRPHQHRSDGHGIGPDRQEPDARRLPLVPRTGMRILEEGVVGLAQRVGPQERTGRRN